MIATVIVKVVSTALVLGIVYLVWSLLTRKARREDEHRSELVATGHKVWATVVSTQPTGESAVNNVHRQYAQQYYVQLELDVPQPGGPGLRCSTKAVTPPDWHALQPGDQVQIYQDLHNPQDVALDMLMTPRYLNPLVRLT